MAIGENIMRARERAGLNQEALAAEIGITQSALSKIETGKRKVDAATFPVLAKALGITPVQLVSGEFDGDGARVALTDDERAIITVIRANEIKVDDAIRALTRLANGGSRAKAKGVAVYDAGEAAARKAKAPKSARRSS